MCEQQQQQQQEQQEEDLAEEKELKRKGKGGLQQSEKDALLAALENRAKKGRGHYGAQKQWGVDLAPQIQSASTQLHVERLVLISPFLSRLPALLDDPCLHRSLLQIIHLPQEIDMAPHQCAVGDAGFVLHVAAAAGCDDDDDDACAAGCDDDDDDDDDACEGGDENESNVVCENVERGVALSPRTAAAALAAGSAFDSMSPSCA